MNVIGTINKTTGLCWLQKETCVGKLTRVLDTQILREYQDMIERVRECRHQYTLELGLTNYGTRARMDSQKVTSATGLQMDNQTPSIPQHLAHKINNRQNNKMQ